MSVAFIFPGRGSQTPGMLHHSLDHPVVARTVDEISEALHSDVRNFDSEQCLQSDVSVQIALLAAEVATARALMEQGVQPAASGADDKALSDWLRFVRDHGAERIPGHRQSSKM